MGVPSYRKSPRVVCEAFKMFCNTSRFLIELLSDTRREFADLNQFVSLQSRKKAHRPEFNSRVQRNHPEIRKRMMSILSKQCTFWTMSTSSDCSLTIVLPMNNSMLDIPLEWWEFFINEGFQAAVRCFAENAFSVAWICNRSHTWMVNLRYIQISTRTWRWIGCHLIKQICSLIYLILMSSW